MPAVALSNSLRQLRYCTPGRIYCLVFSISHIPNVAATVPMRINTHMTICQPPIKNLYLQRQPTATARHTTTAAAAANQSGIPPDSSAVPPSLRQCLCSVGNNPDVRPTRPYPQPATLHSSVVAAGTMQLRQDSTNLFPQQQHIGSRPWQTAKHTTKT